MHAADQIRRLAVLGELRRIGRLVHGDPSAYDDLIMQLEEAWEQLDEARSDEGAPLAVSFFLEELADA